MINPLHPIFFKSHAILHCAAVPGAWHTKHTAETALAQVRQWHLARGFNSEGYHYLIMPDGTRALGRHPRHYGAHTLGHNHALGIVMIETKTIDFVAESPLEWFTQDQIDSARAVIRHHMCRKVTGHNDHAPKLCPGFDVDQDYWLTSP